MESRHQLTDDLCQRDGEAIASKGFDPEALGVERITVELAAHIPARRVAGWY
jgi:hypothetical protein